VVIVEDRRGDGKGFDETLFGENNAGAKRKKKTTKRKKRVA
jgi:hypothetical protein